MSIFPSSPNIGDQYSGYEWDGTAWKVIGIDLNVDYATAQELADALADTTGVHGIADTSTLETQSGAQAKADAAETAANSYTDTAIASFEALPDQTGHGGEYLTTDGSVTSWGAVDVSGEIATHNADTTDVHGIADTSALVVTTDSRLSDARTPTAHAASHGSGGSDAITVAQSQVTNLTTDLAAKAPLASPTFTGTPAAPTAAAGTDTTQVATTAFVQAAVDATATTAVEFRQFAADGSVLANLPARVHPAEQLLKQAVWWIDAAHSSASGQTVSNLGWGGSALDARLGSASGADSNDPKFLDWDGENYVYLPGVAGNYLSVPDEAALDITGDIDIRVRVAMDDWTITGTKTLVARDSTSDRSWSFDIQSVSGKLQFAYTTDGTTGTRVATVSTIAVPFVDGSSGWVRVTRDATTGDVNFYTATDSANVPNVWSQLGAVVSTTPSSIHAGSLPIEIGTITLYNQHATGAFHRAIIKDGIDGTPVLDIDCSQITSGSNTSFTALTGQTVTINRSTSGRKSVAVTHPCWLFGTDDYMEVADGSAGLLDFPAADSGTVLAVVRQWATPVSDGTYIYKRDTASSLAPGWGISSNGTGLSGSLVVEDTADVTALRSTPVFAAGSTAVLAMRIDRSTGVLDGATNGSFGAQTPNITGIADLSNTAAMRVGRRSAFNSNYQDFEGIAFAVFRRALTSGEIATLNSYFQGRA